MQLIKKSAAVIVAIAAITVLLLASNITSAHSHDKLVVTDPVANSVAAAAPEKISLTFNNDVINTNEGTVVEIKNATGEIVSNGVPKINRNTVTQDFAAKIKGAADGIYVVNWRVVSSDGHPIEGSFKFGVGSVSSSDVIAHESAEQTAAVPPQGMPWIKFSLPLAMALCATIIGGALVFLLLRRKAGSYPAEGKQSPSYRSDDRTR
ncbi:copper resistance protein CopC [Canibacter sp. lx-45]|uniref:copper resistance CopC family protein n=1 Tax=Canibacter zhuwentaonis TaxID=2837491 RepID=UPI001BDC6548|nr:copper resistance CopC family protein [Canibacter zhuwentaonis]MBT1034961.1 copper resistance protein CopC [Canibacter zhuwentaonis]